MRLSFLPERRGAMVDEGAAASPPHPLSSPGGHHHPLVIRINTVKITGTMASAGRMIAG